MGTVGETLGRRTEEGASLSRLGSWWKRERVQQIFTLRGFIIGAGATVAGVLGMAGSAGPGVAFRVLGALVTIVGLVLMALAIRRLRRR